MRRRDAGALLLAVAVALGLGGCGSASGTHRVAGSTTTHPAAPAPAPAPEPPAKPTRAGVQLGININRLFNDRAYSVAQIGAELSAVRRTGVTVARSDALWEATEPNPPVGGVHHYDWSFDDLIAGSLAAHGLRWLPILDYSAPWAESLTGQEHSPPRAAQWFADWAVALARRYDAGGAFWRQHPALRAQPVDTYEVWNEPDNRQFWSPRPSARSYAELYLLTREAIDAAEPGARVIVGGLTNAPGFLPALVRVQPALAGQLDGVAIHPYGGIPFQVLAQVREARATLDALGLHSVPLYVTEFGWTTSPRGALGWAPARRRPGYISTTYAALAHTDCAVAAVFLYTWVTPERDPANHEDWFGIAGSRPDVRSFTEGVRDASKATPQLPLCAK